MPTSREDVWGEATRDCGYLNGRATARPSEFGSNLEPDCLEFACAGSWVCRPRAGQGSVPPRHASGRPGHRPGAGADGDCGSHLLQARGAGDARGRAHRRHRGAAGVPVPVSQVHPQAGSQPLDRGHLRNRTCWTRCVAAHLGRGRAARGRARSAAGTLHAGGSCATRADRLCMHRTRDAGRTLRIPESRRLRESSGSNRDLAPLSSRRRTD